MMLDLVIEVDGGRQNRVDEVTTGHIIIIIIIRALALQRNMWSSRSSSQSSSDTHKLSNAKIASLSALKTP
jgi:hypothetical protein